jgi:hypothetical protein
MSQKLFHICNIIAEGEEDYKTLLGYLGNYPLSITQTLPEELYFDTPTLIIGWNCVKDKFPKQNIIDKQISKNLFWSFGKAEDSKDFFKQVEDFFSESVKKWMPSNFKTYDSYLDKETIDVFINDNINASKKTFIYFYDGALYLNNDGNNFIINIKSLSVFDENLKKTITNIFNNLDIVSFSYQNLYHYVDIDNLKQIIALDSLRWVKFGVETLDSYFNIIPNFKIQKYIPFLMSKINSINLDLYEQKFYNRMCERDIITCWLSDREIAFVPTFENSKLDFKIRKNCKLAKINFSNKRTITGRIASKDAYNPQNLDKKNDERKDIISRFDNGKILVFDYISFEPKISVYETKNEEYINKHKSHDLHGEVAKLLYEVENITDEQRIFAKNITNPLIYGQSENSLLEKLSDYKEPGYKLYQVKQYLRPIIDKSNEINGKVKESGFIVTPQGSIVRPEKYFAGYNNYIQAYASEIVVDKLFEIREFLKPYKTQFLFQVHDSLVFDLNPDEEFLIEKINDLLQYHKDMLFGVSHSIGENYKDLK